MNSGWLTASTSYWIPRNCTTIKGYFVAGSGGGGGGGGVGASGGDGGLGGDTVISDNTGVRARVTNLQGHYIGNAGIYYIAGGRGGDGAGDNRAISYISFAASYANYAAWVAAGSPSAYCYSGSIPYGLGANIPIPVSGHNNLAIGIPIWINPGQVLQYGYTPPSGCQLWLGNGRNLHCARWKFAAIPARVIAGCRQNFSAVGGRGGASDASGGGGGGGPIPMVHRGFDGKMWDNSMPGYSAVGANGGGGSCQNSYRVGPGVLGGQGSGGVNACVPAFYPGQPPVYCWIPNWVGCSSGYNSGSTAGGGGGGVGGGGGGGVDPAYNMGVLNDGIHYVSPGGGGGGGGGMSSKAVAITPFTTINPAGKMILVNIGGGGGGGWSNYQWGAGGNSGAVYIEWLP